MASVSFVWGPMKMKRHRETSARRWGGFENGFDAFVSILLSDEQDEAVLLTSYFRQKDSAENVSESTGPTPVTWILSWGTPFSRREAFFLGGVDAEGVGFAVDSVVLPVQVPAPTGVMVGVSTKGIPRFRAKSRAA